ncbi:hypothetical protein [Draconibacterium orientale]|uniref:hypothetical protein n=1 Tax=Draconibacterium orientale TaxID=1168034 RepID=UPI0029C03EE0|nr:hypothetical protein [Draconibacterium orientale]
MKTRILKSKNVSFLVIILYTVFSFGTHSTYAQTNCDVDINAKKNRNSKNISTEGSAYRMVITNNGSNTDTFVLRSIDINNTCTNPDGSSNADNVVLNYNFLDSENNKITSVTLSPGETYNFLVAVIVPNGTATNKWSCVEIVASSTNCENYSSSTVLQSMVIDPSVD